MATFQWEPLAKLLREPNVNDLLLEHWHELGVHKDVMPLDPDYELMLNAEEAGLFKVWTARENDTLIGYVAFWIRPHVHYRSTQTAIEDLFLLTASHRKGWTGVKLWKTALEALREHGVKRVITHSKCHFEHERGGLAKFFQRLGFTQMDQLYSRML